MHVYYIFGTIITILRVFDTNFTLIRVYITINMCNTIPGEIECFVKLVRGRYDNNNCKVYKQTQWPDVFPRFTINQKTLSD